MCSLLPSPLLPFILLSHSPSSSFSSMIHPPILFHFQPISANPILSGGPCIGVILFSTFFSRYVFMFFFLIIFFPYLESRKTANRKTKHRETETGRLTEKRKPETRKQERKTRNEEKKCNVFYPSLAHYPSMGPLQHQIHVVVVPWRRRQY